MSLSGSAGSSDITPYRGTEILLDCPDFVATELPFTHQKQGKNIVSAPFGAHASADVAHLGTGAWAMAPRQSNRSNASERTEQSDAVIRAAHWNLAQHYVEVPAFAKNPATGITYDANVVSSGDHFLQRRIPASGSWANANALTADQAGYGQPTLPTSNASMDRHGVSKNTYPENQSYYFLFEIPGRKSYGLDFIKVFYFGGAADSYGHGQFCVAVNGSGYAYLYERTKYPGDTNYVWRIMDLWKYSSSVPITGEAHTMQIFIYGFDKGGYIEFSSRLSEHIVAKSPSHGITGAYIAPKQSPSLHVYKLPPLRVNIVPKPRIHVTGPGKIRMDGRRDIRPRKQIQVLRFPLTATLKDYPFVIPFHPTVRTNIRLSWDAETPTGTSIAGKLYNVSDDTELTPVSSGADYKEYAIAQGKNGFYAVFTFTGDGSKTPVLWAYQIAKDGVIADTTGVLTQVTVKGTEWNISGTDKDMSHETATCVIKDAKNEATVLKTRASMPCQIQTKYDSGDPSKKSILFRGYVQRAESLKKPRGKQGLNSAGKSVTYPNDDWREYHLTCMGMWMRLAEQLSLARYNFAVDPNSTSTPKKPWKITDIIRQVFQWCGFDSSQIDVPDFPLRLFPPTNADNDIYLIQFGQPLFEYAQRLATDYLGAYILYDPNAGERGMIRLKFAPRTPFNNLLRFRFSPEASGSPRSVMHPGTYANSHGNWVQPEGGGEVMDVPILARNGRSTWRSWVRPPDANCVTVSGKGIILSHDHTQLNMTRTLVNPKSYNFFTDESGIVIETADPNHPDFLNRVVPTFLINNALPNSQAVEHFTVRMYNVLCHATKMAVFEAPLALVWDSDDTNQTKPRAPRLGDGALALDRVLTGYDEESGEAEYDEVESQWMIRDCNPTYVKDHVQMALYEIEAPRLTFV